MSNSRLDCTCKRLTVGKSSTKPPRVVDLFCGCGGLTLGAELAGFRSVVGVDCDETLQSAYRKNFPKSKSIEANLVDVEAADWRRLAGKTKPDLVIGGPPCQGFSWIGRRQPNDPRNSLVFHFYRHVEHLRPKVFVMENVEGLLHETNVKVLSDSIEQVASQYVIIGPITINAADHGAATSRTRVFVIGFDPTCVDPIPSNFMTGSNGNTSITVRDAIADLPSPLPATSNSNDFRWAKYPKSDAVQISRYAAEMRTPPPNGLGWKNAAERLIAGFVSGIVATRHSKEVANRYARVQGGKTDPITKSFRLEWDGLCPTLRAGTGSDKGAFQAVRPLHPSMGRVITVREAARLQGFPDWFVFHPTKWHSFRMLGNSVAPPVSHNLFASISSYLHA